MIFPVSGRVRSARFKRDYPLQTKESENTINGLYQAIKNRTLQIWDDAN
jgi:hypothetical protein